MKRTLSRAVQGLFSAFGMHLTLDRPVRNAIRLLTLKAAELNINTVLDVGANRGQFALKLRTAGYRGTIVSFEPLSFVHPILQRNAQNDQRWIVPARMALGSKSGEAQINVSENLDSSSLLGVERRSIDAAPETHYVSTDDVIVRTLDEVMQPGWRAPFALKLDTQGFELEVLKGADHTLLNTVLVMTELSLAPLYGGGATVMEIFHFLENRGFRCIGLTEGFVDTARNELLQMDGIFIRDVRT